MISADGARQACLNFVKGIIIAESIEGMERCETVLFKTNWRSVVVLKNDFGAVNGYLTQAGKSRHPRFFLIL